MNSLLTIRDLHVGFDTPAGELQAVRGVSLDVNRGEVLAVVGESGSGKSVLCKSIMRLLPPDARITEGTIIADGIDITALSEKEMTALRSRLFAMIFQDPLSSLNPSLSIGAQIDESVRLYDPSLDKAAVRSRTIELMELAGIDRAAQRCNLYPRNFSGGMRQRCVMAIALAGSPKILIADEPTTALDVTIQAQILDIFRDLQTKLDTATIFVTHDLGVVAGVADKVAVMYAGKIVEYGTVDDIFSDPRHPYTWGLLRSLPYYAGENSDRLYSIKGRPPILIHPPSGDAFAPRSDFAMKIDYRQAPPFFQVSPTHWAATWLAHPDAPETERPLAGRKNRPAEHQLQEHQIQAKQLQEKQLQEDQLQEPQIKEHQIKKLQIQKHQLPDCPLARLDHVSLRFKLDRHTSIRALDDVSLEIRKNEILGLVGESGSGKSTAAKCLINILKPDSGSVWFKDIDTADPACFRRHRDALTRERRIIFQDAAGSLNSRMRVDALLREPLKILKTDSAESSRRILEMLADVGLTEDVLSRYPSELSGGMQQRVAIARSLLVRPQLLIADEPVSSLDSSVQAQIVNLFKDLQQKHGFSLLFVAHDLEMVSWLCDRTAVMHNGHIVEIAPSRDLFKNPLHAYTRSLLSAVPVPDPELERNRHHLDYHGEEDSGALIQETPQHFVRRLHQPSAKIGEHDEKNEREKP
ncbi:MAG: dipeptide ABC transporter ATP-binding protein [Eubacteriaceae bacterium]|jgi:peptide/nickel transport system ATP-binding protein